MTELVAVAILVVLAIASAFMIGHSAAHADLLAQCKSEDRGIHLYVDGKRYFYYCSYEKP